MDKSTPPEAPKKLKQLYKLTKNPTLIYLLEQQIYNIAHELTKADSEPYSAGFWKSKALPGGGFIYVLQSKKTFNVQNKMNGAEVKDVNASVLSASAFLMALLQFSIYLHEQTDEEELRNTISLLYMKIYESSAGFRRKKDVSDFLRIID